jgi:tripartite-type tricarboxylate transporter receptor subunit TctC
LAPIALLAAAIFALATGGSQVHAQAPYPSRTIMMVVPFPAGGPTDIIARILAAALQQSLGQNVIIDNRVGAGGNLGIAYVARANPDGYTLLFTSTAIAVNPGLFTNLPYDPIKDFAPISELVNAPTSSSCVPIPASTRSRTWSPRPRPSRTRSTMPRPASAPSRISPASS